MLLNSAHLVDFFVVRVQYDLPLTFYHSDVLDSYAMRQLISKFILLIVLRAGSEIKVIAV